MAYTRPTFTSYPSSETATTLSSLCKDSVEGGTSAPFSVHARPTFKSCPSSDATTTLSSLRKDAVTDPAASSPYTRPTFTSYPSTDTTTTFDSLRKDAEKEGASAAVFTSGRGSTADSADRPSDVCPDGGWKAWSVIFGLFLMLFCSFGYLSAWGVFQAFYESPDNPLLPGSSSATIAWIGSIQTALGYFVPFFTGPMFDKGYYRSTLIVGCIGVVVSTFLVAECKVYWHFVVCQGLLTGVAIGVLSGISPVLVPQWFKKRLGLAFGLSSAGTPLGGVVVPIVARILLPRIGFAWTMRVFAFAFAALLLVCCFLIKARTSPQVLPGQKLFKVGTIKKGPYFTYICSILVIFLGLYTFPSYVASYARSIGVPESRALYMVSIFNAGSGIGRVLGGPAGDIFGPLNMQIPSLILVTILTWAWPFAKSEATLLVVTIFFGIVFGVYVALQSNPVVDMVGPGDLGRLLGLMWAFAGIGALVSLPVPAQIQNKLGVEAMGFYTGSTILAGTILAVVARLLVTKKVIGKA